MFYSPMFDSPHTHLLILLLNAGAEEKGGSQVVSDAAHRSHMLAVGTPKPRVYMPGPGAVPVSLLLHQHERVHVASNSPHSPTSSSPLSSVTGGVLPLVPTASASPKKNSKAVPRIRNASSHGPAPSQAERALERARAVRMATQREMLMQLPELIQAGRDAPGKKIQERAHKRQIRFALIGGESPLARSYLHQDSV